VSSNYLLYADKKDVSSCRKYRHQNHENCQCFKVDHSVWLTTDDVHHPPAHSNEDLIQTWIASSSACAVLVTVASHTFRKLRACLASVWARWFLRLGT
jgi:hypothetical protein